MATEITVSPLVGFLFIVGFVLAFGNLAYQSVVKYRYHYRLGKHLYPNQVDKFFLLTNGWSSDFDLPTLIWFYSPIYFKKIDESELDQEAKTLLNQVKKASRKVIVALGFYVGFLGMFFLLAALDFS